MGDPQSPAVTFCSTHNVHVFKKDGCDLCRRDGLPTGDVSTPGPSIGCDTRDEFRIGRTRKVTVTVEVDLVPDQVYYDLGALRFVCAACKTLEAFDYAESHERGRRGGGPNFEGRCTAFLQKHAQCVTKAGL